MVHFIYSFIFLTISKITTITETNIKIVTFSPVIQNVGKCSKNIHFHCNPGTLHAKIAWCEETFGSSWFSVLKKANAYEQC